MSEQDNDLAAPDELSTLKGRADLLGLKYHPSISVDKLRAKIAAHLSDDKDDESEPAAQDAAPAESENARRARLQEEANRLVRIRVTCMNPAKKEWDGEIFTTGNSTVGSLKKYVPFNADEGWHVPQMILTMMQERQCQIFVTKTDTKGNKTRQGKLIKEFAIEILPPLTKTELDELARRQAMAAGQTV